MDPALTEIRRFWHLGPFSNDPHGIAAADGLVYLADDRDYFTDTETGEENRGGTKVFIFLPEDNPIALYDALPFLPLRCPLPADSAAAADISGDNVIDFKDFAALANDSYKTAADINGDGVVDFDDVAILANNWLKTGIWVWWR